MEEVHVKLEGKRKEGNRYLSKLRQTNFDEIWADNTISKQRKICIFAGVIHTFVLSEEARMVYVMFSRSDTNPQKETSIFHLIRLNTSITDSIDMLFQAIEEAKIILKEDCQLLPKER